MIFNKESRSRKRNEKLLKFITLPDAGKILDLSCGDGTLLAAIHRLKPNLELFGTDISNQSLNPKIVFQVSKADHIPHPDETFDVLICSMSLHHYKSISSVLVEIQRVLKTGGKLYIMDIMPKNSLFQKFYNLIGCYEPYHFEKFYTQQELSDLMPKFNLKILKGFPIAIVPRSKLMELAKE